MMWKKDVKIHYFKDTWTQCSLENSRFLIIIIRLIRWEVPLPCSALQSSHTENIV